jgi:hypothetical protein
MLDTITDMRYIKTSYLCHVPSQSSMSVSPRRPPPSPYASLSLQSADESSADGSGPLGSRHSGSGALSVQFSMASAEQAQQQQQLQPVPQPTVAQEGRSGSLENGDRAVSFENWKVPTWPGSARAAACRAYTYLLTRHVKT